MTHALVNPVATDAGYMPVACNPLQRYEESLGIRQMEETQGGVLPAIIPALIAGAKLVAPWVLGTASGIVAGYVVAEITSNNGGGSCCCKK